MTTLLCKQDPSLTLASQMLLNLSALPNLCETQSIKRIISVGEWTVAPMAFFCCPHLSQYYFRYSAVITWHGCAFIFKNERHLLAKNGVDKYIFLCVGDFFLRGSQCKEYNSGISCLLFVLQTGMAVQQVQSWKKKRIISHHCTFASVHVGVHAGTIICYAFNHNYLIL